MRQPEPVQGFLDAVDGREVPLEGLVVPLLVGPVPAVGQLDAQLPFDGGDEVGLALADEVPHDFVDLQLPAEIGQHPLVHPDGDHLGVHQDAVAVENHQFKGVRAQRGRSHSAMLASWSRSASTEPAGSRQTMPRHR